MCESSCNISWREKPISVADGVLVRPHQEQSCQPCSLQDSPSMVPFPSLEGWLRGQLTPQKCSRQGDGGESFDLVGDIGHKGKYV